MTAPQRLLTVIAAPLVDGLEHIAVVQTSVALR